MFDRQNRRVHLGEEHLQAAVVSCPVCGSNGVSPVGRIQSSPAVHLLECGRCRAISADRMPVPSALRAYYAAYYKGCGDRTTSNAGRIARHAFRLLRPILCTAGKPLRLLDFGGGDGSIAVRLGRMFLAEGRATAVDVTLVDLNAADRFVPPAIRFRWCRELDDLPREGSYDVILASGILEHLPEPNRALATLLHRLDAPGMLYGRTPFRIAFHRLFSRLGIGPAIPYPGHLHDLGRDYWDRVLGVLGLGPEYRMVRSETGCVETALFSRRWPEAVLSHLLKLPSRIPGLRDGYDWVGGWEAVILRRERSTPVGGGATPSHRGSNGIHPPDPG